MISNSIFIVLGLITGAVLAAVFFGGLWLAVRLMARGRSAGLWLVAGFFLRFAVCCAVFYLAVRFMPRRVTFPASPALSLRSFCSSPYYKRG